MNKYAKLVNGVLFYAPSGMNNILGYNLDSNWERLLADGYKLVRICRTKTALSIARGITALNIRKPKRPLKNVRSIILRL